MFPLKLLHPSGDLCKIWKNYLLAILSIVILVIFIDILDEIILDLRIEISPSIEIKISKVNTSPKSHGIGHPMRSAYTCK